MQNAITLELRPAKPDEQGLLRRPGPGSLEDKVVELKLAERSMPRGRHQRSTSDSAALLQSALSSLEDGWPGAATRRELHFADDTAAAWQPPSPQLADRRRGPTAGPSGGSAGASAVAVGRAGSTKLRTVSMPPLDLSALVVSAEVATQAEQSQLQPDAAYRPSGQLQGQRSLGARRPPALDVQVSARSEPAAHPQSAAVFAASAAANGIEQWPAGRKDDSMQPELAKRPSAADPFAMCAQASCFSLTLPCTRCRCFSRTVVELHWFLTRAELVQGATASD